jgi:hypothetical protein
VRVYDSRCVEGKAKLNIGYVDLCASVCVAILWMMGVCIERVILGEKKEDLPVKSGQGIGN